MQRLTNNQLELMNVYSGMKLYRLDYTCWRVRKKRNGRIRTQYRLEHRFVYRDKVSGKSLTLEEGMWSDGSSGGTDVASIAWWVHDEICETWRWDDGTPISVRESSRILKDLLLLEGRPVRAYSWGIGTYFWQLAKYPFRKERGDMMSYYDVVCKKCQQRKLCMNYICDECYEKQREEENNKKKKEKK